ncbi:MAG TPA: efflux RND transporter permease subunit, partial [Gammaproteobacteria bacterium]|nr:efflux RND transporter permease subunit [Gammaproteobacteria bacterium]
QPLIKPMGIDDVPIVTVTFWSEDESVGSFALQQVSHAIEAEIKRIPNTRIVETTGGPQHVVHVQLNPEDLVAYNLDFKSIENALKASNFATYSGNVIENNQIQPVQTGTLLANVEDIKNLVVAVNNGMPVYLTDIATISNTPDSPDNYVWMTGGKAWKGEGKPDFSPAVTLAIGKKAGSNAVDIADAVIAAGEKLRATHIPENVNFEITRNYGKTADDKAQKLMTKLMFATASVVLLILVALGWREAIVVGLAVSITLAVTLFASWAYGFTLNRVSLFALIFSIGILVDDAVVIVENIHRHLSLGKKKLSELIPLAVDEVGGPTILATFTVIAALMPMAFVTGLMGPYMSPVPINASMGMLLSLIIALIVTPWLFAKIIGNKVHHSDSDGSGKPGF